MKKVYCLYRVSDRGQVEKNDIPMQKIACRTFAECHGWEIVKEFAEKGVSGYKWSMDERDAIVQIKEDAALGKFDILLVFMFDRIGRRDDETPFAVEWLTRQGVAVWSVCEGEQRFENHVDKLTNYIRYWQAAGESERISERTRTRIRQLTEEGLFTGGVCPYGYQLVRQGRENKRKQPLYDLAVCPEEAEVVKQIFEKAGLEGWGVYRIAKWLDQAGHYPKSGKSWPPASLYSLLKNPLYTGVVHKGGVSSYQPQLQIISQELFDEARRLHSGKTREERAAPRIEGALLSGFLYCGICGAPLASNHINRRYQRQDGTVREWRIQRYYCPRPRSQCAGQRIYQAEKVDQIFLEELSRRLSVLEEHTPAELAARRHSVLSAEIEEKLQQAICRQEALDDEIRLLKAETVACLRGQSDFPAAQISAMLSEAEARRTAIADCINELTAQKAAVTQTVKELELRIEKYRNLWAEFPAASLERKKVILSHFVRGVKISRGYQISVGHIKLNGLFRENQEGNRNSLP